MGSAAVRRFAALNDILEKRKNHPIFEFELFKFLGFGQIRELEGKYLSAEAMAKYAASSGVYNPDAK